MPRLHAGQEEVRNSSARFKVLACGRRWGKTQLCSALAFERALLGGLAWWVAPSYDVAKIGWRKVGRLAGQIPGASILKSDREILLPTGGRIVIRSAEGQKSLRGEGIDTLIMDEAPYIDERVWTADLRPALADRKGNAVFIGTPNGRNWFYRLYRRGQESGGDYQSWQLTSYTNPFVADSEIDAAKGDSPEWAFRQEYMAEFVTFEGKVYKSFDPAGPNVFDEGLDLGRYRGGFFGAMDFGFRNPTVLGVAGDDGDDGLDVVDSVYASGMKSPEIIDHSLRLTEEYDIIQWWADPSDPGMIAELQAAGVPVIACPRVKGGLENSWIKNGISKVESMLSASPPRLRFYGPNCAGIINDMDLYRYSEVRSGAPEKEAPLKVDDHGCDKVRYLVEGWSLMRAIPSEAVVL